MHPPCPPPPPGVYNEVGLQALDQVMADAAARGLRVVLILARNWGGGADSRQGVSAVGAREPARAGRCGRREGSRDPATRGARRALHPRPLPGLRRAPLNLPGLFARPPNLPSPAVRVLERPEVARRLLLLPRGPRRL